MDWVLRLDAGFICYIITLILRSVCQLLVTANVVPSSPILVTQMKEALHSSETSVLNKSHVV
jgi:hypothetical protein